MKDGIRPLRSARDHAGALKEVERLIGAEPGSEDADRLAVLTVLIADYERRTYATAPAAPVEAVMLDMRLHGRTQADLSHVLGSRSRASEVLAGRRAITPQMADRLSRAWQIPRELLGPRSAAARKRRIIKGAGVLAFIFAGLFGSAGAYYAWALRDLPSIAPLLAAREAPDFVALEEVPAHVRQAFLAAEDSDFYAHRGTSVRGLARATLDTTLNAVRSRRPSGGATITHQLVKQTLLKGEPRSLRRRLRVMALGSSIEAELPKDRIFELYLNKLYFGGDLRGLRAASLHYFSVEPRDLSVAQGAMLAAMPAAPNAMRVDLAENLPRAHERRAWVLARMSDEGYLTSAAVARASAAPLR